MEYVKQLITDLNGGAMSDPRETFAKAMMSKFKKAKVMASLSVVIQQPSAIGRAFALVSPRFFQPTKDGMNHEQLWSELKKYAPVAVIKEMGYFDTNMGMSTKDFITAKEYTSFKEKAKAIFTDGNFRDEQLSKLPALADELTWCAIWNAVKRETVSTHTDLRPGSEEFLKAAGERFTEVVTKTQVYDSVLARSANMRSKSGMMNMATSFMAEPTTTINMLEDAIYKAKRGNRGYAAKVFASVATSMDGEITRYQAIELLKDNTNKGEKEDKKWDFELDYGFSWSERVRKYRLGKISKTDLMSAVMDIEGETRSGAEEYIRFLNLEMANENFDITASDASSYFKHAEPAGISVTVYLDYKDKVSQCEGDKDKNGKTIRGSKKDKVLAVINSMPISNAQKDVLYFAEGYDKDTIRKAPWH